jgi:hypothetical protein
MDWSKMDLIDHLEQVLPTTAGLWAGSTPGARNAFARGYQQGARFTCQWTRGACFAAGTPLRVPGGSKPVEQFQEGDRILARPEGDPEAAAEVKAVEEVFVRLAPVLGLRVGGKVIRTTAEHPFWVRGKGWTVAGQLRAGDELSSHEGGWVAVEGLDATGEWHTVYNLRVADCHTYFVGCEQWGFSVWAHNAEYGDLQGQEASVIPEIQQRLQQWHQGQGSCDTHSLALTAEFQQAGVYAAMRSPTGPGQHNMVSLAPRPIVVDVTASQFVHQAPNPSAVSQQFYRELYVTGVWTYAEYNAFLQSINPSWHY